MPAALRAAVAVVVVIGVFAVMSWTSTMVTTIQCDGSVPAWMIPDDYDQGGCVELRPPWEGILPWNVLRNEGVCLGLCGPLDLAPAPNSL